MMDIRTCKSCKKIFNYLSGPILCPSCKEELENKFQEVKAYIDEHPGVGINEVSEECDVEPGQIRQWLREERLQLAEGSGIMLACESCGKMIRSGKFCEDCRVALANNFQDLVRGKEPMNQTLYKKQAKSAKMRFLK